MATQRAVILPDGIKIEYTLERKSVKNVNLRIKEGGKVYVSAAPQVPTHRIDELVRQNAEYILNCQNTVREREKKMHEYDDNSVAQLWGNKMQVVYKERVCVRGDGSEWSFSGDVLTVMLKTPDDPKAQARAKEACLRNIAEWVIGEICELEYPKFMPYGVEMPEIRMRKMKKAWGSCQPERGILTFNTELVRANPDCIRYVVVHEFCHFVHPNHSPAFRALLTELMPDWKARKKLLDETVI